MAPQKVKTYDTEVKYALHTSSCRRKHVPRSYSIPNLRTQRGERKVCTKFKTPTKAIGCLFATNVLDYFFFDTFHSIDLDCYCVPLAIEGEESYLETNRYMFDNKVACDTVFEALSLTGNQVSIPAHKYVLISRNCVFKAMLCGPLASGSTFIQITDLSSEALIELFRFIYYGVAHLDENNVLELLYSSSKYMIPSLGSKCSDYLAKNLDSDNVCMILEYANLYNQEDLIHKCVKFIRRHTTNVLDSESYKNAQKEIVQLIFSQDSLNATEDTLVTALLRWAEAHVTFGIGPDLNRKLMIKNIYTGLVDKIRVNSLSENKRKDLLESDNDLAIQLAVDLGLGESHNHSEPKKESKTPRLELPTGRVNCDVIAKSASSLICNGHSCAPLMIKTSEPIIIHKIHLLDRFHSNIVRVNLSIIQNNISLLDIEIPCDINRKTTERGPIIVISLPEDVGIEEGQFNIESRFGMSHGTYTTVQVGEPKCQMQKFSDLELTFSNLTTATPVASFQFSVI